MSGKNKTEAYLDSLLSSISPEQKRQVQEKKDSRYMADFERELEHMDMEKFVQDFEKEIDREENGGGSESSQTEEEFFENLEGIVENAQGMKKDSPDQGEENFEVNTMADDSWTNTGSDGGLEESGGSADGSGDETDFMDVLAESARESDEALSAVNDILAKNEVSDSSEGITEVSLSDIVDEGDSSGKKKKKREKGQGKGKGFWQKLSRVLFGEDDKEESPGSADSEGISDEFVLEGGEIETISAENLQILQELEGGGSGGSADEAQEDAKGQKGKKKKEKKKKPKKEKKPKEKKPRKEKKPKKPKKPKEVDLSPPLPKAPVILIFVMGISIIILVLLCANLLNYSQDITVAKKAYQEKDYVKAYQTLEGMKLKTEDEALYQQALVMARVQSEYVAGDNLYAIGEYTRALDSYICALGRFDANQEDAVVYGAGKEYGMLEEMIVVRLSEQFNVSPETAREIYGLEDRSEYTIRIYQIVKSLGMIEEQT